FITCVSVVKDANGQVTELHCTYDPATRGGNAPDGRRVKATIHWVSAAHAVDAEIRIYENLFTVESPTAVEELNPASLEVLTEGKLEPALKNAKAGERYQFERLGYFCVDPDTKDGHLVFNRTVALRDSWAKIEKKNEKKARA